MPRPKIPMALASALKRGLELNRLLGDTGFVPSLGLRRIFHVKADRAAVGMCRLATVRSASSL
jgi:hypothetical protein